MNLSPLAPAQTPPASFTVRAFRPEDAAAFRALNQAWIERWFSLEPEDIALLGDPQAQILDRGGQIFIATAVTSRQGGGEPASAQAGQEEVVGCFALLPLPGDTLRLVRMTVSEARRGQGLGRLLLERAIAAARDRGATRIVLETSRRLTAAVRLYESAGFTYLPPASSPMVRADLFMELRLNPG